MIFLPPVRRFRPQIALLSVVALIVATLIFNDGTAFPGTAALLPVLATAGLIATTSKWPPVLKIISSFKFTQWMGAISYPLYLWHWPLLVIPVLHRGNALHSVEIIARLALTFLLADLTHRFIEEPLRYRQWSSTRSLKFAAVTTVISISLGAGIYFSYSNTITLSGSGSYSLDEIRSKPANDADGCHIHVRETVSPLCEYGDTTSDKTIVLYGDSHAAQWLPALNIIGERRGFKIVSLTKSACPSAEVIKELSSQYIVADCQKFRDNSIARITKIKPVAVILTGMQPFRAPYSNKDALPFWLAGEKKALLRIAPHTQFPIYLTDTPLPHRDIPDCLVSGLGAICDDSTPINPTVASGFIAINPTPWLCRESCSAIVDGIVAYRDQSHLTVAMSEHLAPRLESELARIGVFESR